MYTGRLIISISGTELSEEYAAIIQHPLTFGCVLFSSNFTNTEQLTKLVTDIFKASKESGKKDFPIFADQEGGYVQRFQRSRKSTKHFIPLPPAATFGVVYDASPEAALETAQKYGHTMATELLDYGIINLGPVLDLQAGNTVIEGLGRAFHHHPESCTNIARAYIKGMATKKMTATGKHFPGHGQDIGDSHTEYPKDNRTLSEIEQQDLLPFTTLIKEGLLAAIMPAHILYPQIDPEYIVANSKTWIEDILRTKLGFTGALVSDCLSMKGAGEKSDLEKTQETLKYCDAAILCHKTPDEYKTVLDGLSDGGFEASAITNTRFEKWIGPTKNLRQVKTAT